MYYVKDYIIYRNAIFSCQIPTKGQTASVRYVKSASCHVMTDDHHHYIRLSVELLACGHKFGSDILNNLQNESCDISGGLYFNQIWPSMEG